eukprot:NODE_738_length_2403_cov_48.513158_g631_i0.p1 GENE.NODE_738_length_2403_cov_48.513158_g631_i0~~NODE_738_length_2403_cov_48.513158_g631_i0.p1  ORF type:complete len:707 (-),score=142.86 NODE_738_length_2403_cov_48.513158_g631_i0:196-2316(-)
MAEGWSVQDVVNYVSLMGLGSTDPSIFRQYNVDGATLINMTTASLKAIGVASLADRKIILDSIKNLPISSTGSESVYEGPDPVDPLSSHAGTGTPPPSQVLPMKPRNKRSAQPATPSSPRRVSFDPDSTSSVAALGAAGGGLSFDIPMLHKQNVNSNSTTPDVGGDDSDEEDTRKLTLEQREERMKQKERQLKAQRMALAQREEAFNQQQEDFNRQYTSFLQEKRRLAVEAPPARYTISPSVVVADEQGIRLERITSIIKRLDPHANPYLYSKENGPESEGVVSLCTRDLLRRDDSMEPMKGGKFVPPAASKVAKAVMEIIYQQWVQHEDNTFAAMQNDRSKSFYKLVLSLCEYVNPILQSDPLCLNLKSPLYVLGDIHGNFHDLHFFMEQLLNFGQLKYTPTNFLFLGDYVDRGPGSVQVAAYLLAMKVLSPIGVYLLRGNHEVWTVNGDQMQYGDASFKSCCQRMFGIAEGNNAWEKFNESFSLLPLCAVVDNKIFCVHGGIPRYSGGPDRRLQTLCEPSFPRFYGIEFNPSDPPETRFYKQLAFQMLWNDPADEETGLDEYGFGPNPKRGPDIYSFGLAAIQMFLQRHDLQFIIRAHEVKQEGLRVCKSAQVITVFTSSQYCGGENGSAAVYIDRGKLRFITHIPNGSRQPYVPGPISQRRPPSGNQIKQSASASIINTSSPMKPPSRPATVPMPKVNQRRNS